MKTAANIFFTLFLAMSTSIATAGIDEARNAFEQGNNAYKNGDYTTALAQYKLADSLSDGAAIDYNLGNTYFKLKKWPDAILHYERALKFAPANEDIRHNLRLANERIVDRIETLPKSKAAIWWEDFRYGIGPDGWAWISIALAVVCVLAFLLYWVGKGVAIKRFGFFSGIVLFLLVIAAITLAASAEKYRYTHVSGIIFTDKVDIKSEPREVANSMFVLHAGTKVAILSHDGDWYEISIASGNKGWIAASDLREI
jgi:tetratricopeptide (TPR) repeat protein